MRRDVLVESGYRCAMPRCRATQIEIHHIIPYTVVQEHTFDNLIVLCANCHQRVTNGEIERPAVQQIKANLSVLGNRYGDLERRYLQVAAQDNLVAGAWQALPGGFELLMRNLVEDGFVLARRSVARTERELRSSLPTSFTCSHRKAEPSLIIGSPLSHSTDR